MENIRLLHISGPETSRNCSNRHRLGFYAEIQNIFRDSVAGRKRAMWQRMTCVGVRSRVHVSNANLPSIECMDLGIDMECMWVNGIQYAECTVQICGYTYTYYVFIKVY